MKADRRDTASCFYFLCHLATTRPRNVPLYAPLEVLLVLMMVMSWKDFFLACALFVISTT